jgi:hypothetical protein
VDQTNYGEGPLVINVVTYLKARGVQFDPKNLGSILDPDVPLDDPRMKFTNKGEGENVTREKPLATKFMDFLVWLPEQQQLLAMSLKSTDLKKAIQLLSLLKYPIKLGGKFFAKPPMWARNVEVGSTPNSDGTNSWLNYSFKEKGAVDANTFKLCGALYEAYAGKRVVIDRTPDVMDPDHPDAEREPVEKQREF